jgi:hypothetical protein
MSTPQVRSEPIVESSTRRAFLRGSAAAFAASCTSWGKYLDAAESNPPVSRGNTQKDAIAWLDQHLKPSGTFPVSTGLVINSRPSFYLKIEPQSRLPTVRWARNRL